MKRTLDAQTQKPSTLARERRSWSAPVSLRRGSVAELVAITKISGRFDTGGTKRNPPSQDDDD